MCSYGQTRTFIVLNSLGWPDTWVGREEMNQGDFATKIRRIFLFSKILTQCSESEKVNSTGGNLKKLKRKENPGSKTSNFVMSKNVLENTEPFSHEHYLP